MKKLYILSFFLTLLFISGCSKDFLKRYERRIVGTWRLIDIDRIGIGGNMSTLPFRYGEFVFDDAGQLRFTDDLSGTVYNGSWDISRHWIGGDCYVDEDGDRNCDNKQVKALSLMGIDFAGQNVKSEFFNEIVFTGTDRFRAYIYSGFHTYVYRFRR